MGTKNCMQGGNGDDFLSTCSSLIGSGSQASIWLGWDVCPISSPLHIHEYRPFRLQTKQLCVFPHTLSRVFLSLLLHFTPATSTFLQIETQFLCSRFLSHLKFPCITTSWSHQSVFEHPEDCTNPHRALCVTRLLLNAIDKASRTRQIAENQCYSNTESLTLSLYHLYFHHILASSCIELFFTIIITTIHPHPSISAPSKLPKSTRTIHRSFFFCQVFLLQLTNCENCRAPPLPTVHSNCMLSVFTIFLTRFFSQSSK